MYQQMLMQMMLLVLYYEGGRGFALHVDCTCDHSDVDV